MALTKSVEIEVTVDRLEVNFANGAVTIAGTSKGMLLGKSYTLTMPPSKTWTDFASALQTQVTDLVDKTGALWRA